VIPRLDLRGSTADAPGLLPRARLNVAAAVEAVRPICAAVEGRGVDAIKEITARLDGVELASTRVPKIALDDALTSLDPALRAALEELARRVRRVPAQVAGVDSIAVASPPQRDRDGLPHPAILAACALLRVDQVYSVGGAQAVAMFAYGTEECRAVDLVTGPGNVYVAAAKRLVRGVVGTDAEAGPTEVAILADETARPAYVAADLVAQAEHDENAACLLVTPDARLLDAVDAELGGQVASTRHRARVETALTSQSAAVLVDDLDHGLAVVDQWAPEHLEVLTADAKERAHRVSSAGAIFVGPWSPVSLGDYLAGSNHVLPTGGTARHTGGLSVQSFLRSVHVVDYTREALAAARPHIEALGAAEDLAAHVVAVQARVIAVAPASDDGAQP
jgi:histidinol dehydrogenase